MKRIFLIISLLNFYITMTPVMAQIGEPYIHDPSTLAECDGKYYTFGTGGGGSIILSALAEVVSLATTAGLGTVALTVLVAVLPPTS